MRCRSKSSRRQLSMESLELRQVLAAAAVITEFMASNDRTLRDQDGDFADWIELHNSSDQATQLEGWYLTDSAEQLTKWRLPSITIEPGGYLLVFASGKNRIDPHAELHTNFKLSANGEYLAVVQPDGTTIAQQFNPGYPAQTPDVSYGFADDLAHRLFFSAPTPGAANGPGWTGVAGRPTFSAPRGFYDSPLDLLLSTDTPGGQVRYTIDGSVPRADSGLLYESPIRLCAPQLCARRSSLRIICQARLRRTLTCS